MVGHTHVADGMLASHSFTAGRPVTSERVIYNDKPNYRHFGCVKLAKLRFDREYLAENLYSRTSFPRIALHAVAPEQGKHRVQSKNLSENRERC
jgi:hypothetical protein